MCIRDRALLEGIVPGGGTLYLKLYNKLSELMDGGKNDIGIKMVRESLTVPFRQLLLNAEYSQKGIKKMEKLIINNPKLNVGYDFINDRVVDMMQVNIVDPSMVSRVAIQNSVSVVSQLLSTEVIITDHHNACLLYTSPSPRDRTRSRMPSSA